MISKFKVRLMKKRKMSGRNSYKIVLLGDIGVGKTSIMIRSKYDQFRGFTESTIGAAYSHKIVEVVSPDYRKRQVKLDIWDTAGGERYRSIAPMYYRGAYAAIVVFDLSSRSSFDHAQHWVSTVRLETQGRNLKFVYLVGNKSDLPQQVKQQDIDRFVEDFGGNRDFVYYTRTSAKTGENIKELFKSVGELLIGIKPPRLDPDTVDLESQSMSLRSDSSCCGGWRSFSS